ncbi:MAG: DUF2249 domain-containing protein [Limisphaerales bacterium]
MGQKIVTLDVREDIRRGQEPFSKIMRAVTLLKPDEALLLIAPFEPAPLFDVMAGQGFSHQSKATDAGDWEVLFERGSIAAPAAAPRSAPDGCQAGACKARKVVTVDARGLEPPQPLVTILEAVEALPADAELCARTDRKPMHLYTRLLERGFTGITDEQADGSFVTRIRRR